MKGTIIVAGIIIALILVMLSGKFDVTDTPTPTFAISSNELQPLAVTSCSPATGYDYCYYDSYGLAEVKLQFSDWQGKRGYGYIDGANRNYYIDEIYVDVKYEGDYLYKSTASTWMPCSTSGCSGTKISSGKVVLATAPTKSFSGTQFAVWDKTYGSSGSWYATWLWTGWLGTYNYYVIDCYDNTDCDYNQYCDKSGTWDTWSCKVDPCLTMPTPENICDDFDLWSQKCVYGEYVKDQLLEANSLKCGCVIQETPNTCVNFDLYSQIQATPCIEGLVIDQLLESNSGECGYICTAGETKSFSCTDGTEIVTQQCLNNAWVDVKIESCPLNWINLESILMEYLNNIELYLEELLWN